MTYKEIKRRLSKCEKTLEMFKSKDYKRSTAEERQQAQKDIKFLNERIDQYKSLLLKEEKTYILTPKSGKPTAASLGDDEVDALKDADDIQAIKSADGEEVKERLNKNQGVDFSVDETKAIAKKVGKAVAKALKAVGDSVTTMKATHIEENSFDIEVIYKNNSDDAFSFHVINDTLHLADFSFDKELVDVGVKPSGEAIVHVDHLANELQKHFNSLSENVNEVNYNHYKEPKHFDICPGAEALRDKLIDGGKSPEELGEWTYRHDQLFKLEKDVLKSKEAGIKHVSAANKLRAEIIHLSRDLNIDADDVAYLKGHVDKIEAVRMGKDENYDPDQEQRDDEEDHGVGYDDEGRPLGEGEGDDHHYLKVPSADYKKAASILDQNIDPTYVKMEVVDNDGAGNVIFYFIFKHEDGFDDMYDDSENPDSEFYQEPDEDPQAFVYDAVMDLRANDITVTDSSAEMDEAMDVNDPVLMRARVAKKRADDMKKLDAYIKSPEGRAAARAQASAERKEEKAREIVRKLKIKRAEIEREMENDPDIEPQGGPVSDMYGDQLNKIDNAIEKAASVYNKPMDYDTAVGKVNEEEGHLVTFGYDLDRIEDVVKHLQSKYKEGQDFELHIGRGDDLPNAVTLKNPALEKDHDLNDMLNAAQSDQDRYDAYTDYDQRRREEDDYYEDPDYYKESMKEGTDLYDKGGLHIKRFSGGERGLMVQITVGRQYIQVTADQFNVLARAMQSVQGDLKDMSRQLPRRKNVDEIGAAKVQKAHGLVVAKMKELAKQYKAGDKSVVPQLKDLTAKKKNLEKQLDQAVAGTHHSQELTELSGDQRNDLVELQNILDDVNAKGEEAREIIRQSFPRMLSKADAYGAFEFGSSANRYDTTLESIIEEIEEYYDEEEDDMNEGRKDNDALYPDNPRLPEIKNLADKIVSMVKSEADKGELGYIKTMEELRYQQEDDFERTPEWNKAKGIKSDFDDYVNTDEEYKGKHQGSNYKWPMSKATKDRKEADKKKTLKEFTDDRFKGSEVIDDANKQAPDMFGKQLFADLLPKGVASENDAIEALKKHDKSGIKARMGRYAPMFVHMQYHELEHEGEKYRMHQKQYYNSNFKDKDPDFNPAVSAITLMKVDENDEGKNLGTILVKTDEYVQDLRNLRGLGKRHMEEAGPGFMHDCAAHVVHEVYGAGICLDEQHTLVKEGNKHVVTHYDVFFKKGNRLVEDVPAEHLKVITMNEHWHKGYKKKKK